MSGLGKFIGLFTVVSLAACGGTAEQVTEEAPAPVVEEVVVEAPVDENAGPKPIQCSDFESLDTLDPHAEAVSAALEKQAAITWGAKVDVNNEEGTCAAVNVSWGSGEEFDYSGYVKENAYEFQKRLPWLLNLLDRVVPESTIRMTKAEAAAQDATGYLFTVETSLTDGEIMPGKTRAIKTDLRQAITKLEEHSLSPDIPVESATVCLDLQALAIELELDNTNLVDAIKLRTTKEALDSIEVPDFEHIRRGSVTLMDANGRIVQSRDFSHPGVISTKTGECGCDLLIAIAPGVTQQKATHTFDVLKNKDAEKVKWIQAQMSRPGKPMDKIAEIRDIPNDGDPLADYTDLMHLVFQQRVQVVHTAAGSSSISVRVEGNNVGAPSKSALSKQLEKIKKRNDGEEVEKVCLQNSAGKQVTSFSLNAGEAEAFTGTLKGLDSLSSAVVLDVAAAGLGPKGSGYLVVDMDEAQMTSLSALLRARSTLVMKAALSNKTKEDRTAVINLPTERINVAGDGSLKKTKETLRVKAELGAALAIEIDDKVKLEGHGFTIELPLLAFSDPAPAIEALTTRWGSLRTIDVPLRALTVLNSPVAVEYGPGQKNVRVIAQDEVGRSLGESSTSINFPLVAHRPLLGGCTLVLRANNVPPENALEISKLNPWEIRAVKTYLVVYADRQSVHYHFVKSNGCAPTAQNGHAHTLVVSNGGISPLQCQSATP